MATWDNPEPIRDVVLGLKTANGHLYCLTKRWLADLTLSDGTWSQTAQTAQAAPVFAGGDGGALVWLNHLKDLTRLDGASGEVTTSLAAPGATLLLWDPQDALYYVASGGNVDVLDPVSGESERLLTSEATIGAMTLDEDRLLLAMPGVALISHDL